MPFWFSFSKRICSRCPVNAPSKAVAAADAPPKRGLSEQSHSLLLRSRVSPCPSLNSLDLPIPVMVDRLDFLLSGYNHSIAVLLSSGFRDGLPLHYRGVRVDSDASNLVSLSENPDVFS